MSKLGRTIACAVVALGTFLSIASAADAPYFRTPPVPTVSPKSLPALVPNQTYAVDIDCVPNGTAKLAPLTDNGLIQRTWTTSHGILLSTQQTTANVTAGTLPSSGLGMAVVYVTDGTTGSEIDNRNHGCKSTFLVRRQTSVYLIPFISLHTANQAGVVVSILAAAVTPFSSLFSLITGGPLAAATASRLTDFATVEQAFNTILAKLNSDFNYAQSIPLGVGTTTITTSESITTVKVRPISALITDKIDDFSTALRTLADSENANVKVPLNSPDNACAQLSSNLSLDGVIAPEDHAYALAYEGLRLGQSAETLEHCLGKLVQVAASLPQIWVGQSTVITPAQALAFYNANFTGPVQLQFSDIQPQLDQLMIALGRYAQNGQPPSAAYTANLQKLFVSSPSLIDNTLANVFKANSSASGFPDIVNAFISLGYYHFGCYAQDTNATGLYTDNASAIFLAFKAPPSASSVKKSDPNSILAIHPIFADGLYTVQTLDVSDNPDWIATVLAGRAGSTITTSDCNGFQVQ